MRLLGFPHLRTQLFRKRLPQPVQTLVELVRLAVPHCWLPGLQLFEVLPALRRTHTIRIQGLHIHEREYQRQAQAQMDRLEYSIITPTERFRVNLLQTFTHQVERFAFLRVLAYLVNGTTKNLLHGLRLAWGLHCVLSHILNNGPQVQQRAPVDVSKVRQEHMRLVAAHERVITRERRLPLPFPLLLLQANAVTSRTKLVRKAITAVRTFWLASRAGVLLPIRRKLAMAIMTVPIVHEGRYQLPNGIQIHFSTRSSV